MPLPFFLVSVVFVPCYASYILRFKYLVIVLGWSDSQLLSIEETRVQLLQLLSTSMLWNRSSCSKSVYWGMYGCLSYISLRAGASLVTTVKWKVWYLLTIVQWHDFERLLRNDCHFSTHSWSIGLVSSSSSSLLIFCLVRDWVRNLMFLCDRLILVVCWITWRFCPLAETSLSFLQHLPALEPFRYMDTLS